MEVNFKAKPLSARRAFTLNRQLKKSKFVDIICHTSSDEDALACAKTMQWYLNGQSIPSRIIADKCGNTFRYNSGQYAILDTLYDNLPEKPADTVLCVDFSSSSRINDKILAYIKNARNIMCIDHHNKSDADIIQLTGNKNVYIDTSAKSCSGIMLRLFEKLKIKLPVGILQQLYCGMLDDLRKNNYIFYNNEPIPVGMPALKSDQNTKMLYEYMNNTLKPEERSEVISHLNILENLTLAEKEFRNSLPSRINYAADGKFGYIEIPADDTEWQMLGGDTKATSAIMGEFRVSEVKNPDKPDLDCIAIFYPVNDMYRLSIHSRNNNVINLFNCIKERINPTLQSGGHPNRGGGCINSKEPVKCHEWVQEFIKGAEVFYS